MNGTARRILLAATASLACGGAASARELPPEIRAKLFQPTESVELASGSVRIPMRGTDRNGFYECPYFEVFVNGRGPFTFLLDTGSSYTFVSDRVVDVARPALAFDRGGERDVLRLESVDFGGLTLRDVWVIHEDGFEVDGVLGFQALGLQPFAIDFERRELSVGRQPPQGPRSFELAYDAPRHVPLVPLGLGSRTVPVLIDTGDDAYGLELRSSGLGDARVAHVPSAATTVMNGTNGQTTRVTTLVDEVTLGPMRAASAVIGVNDDLPVGDLGYDVLRQFRVTFDPVRQIARFDPLSEGDEFVVAPERNAGFSLRFDGSGTVTRVVAGSPAEAAGLAAGDVVLGIDGKPVSAYTRPSWDGLVDRNQAIALEWRHKGVLRSAAVGIIEFR